MKNRIVTGWLCIGVGVVASHAAQPAAEQSKPASFPTPLSAQLPYDVDRRALASLDRDTQVPEAQRLFDIFAWQCLIALNWPASADGTADTSKTMADNKSPRVWMGWKNNEDVFRPDGQKPTPWDAREAVQQKEHYMWRFSKMLNERRSPENILHESVQAFTGPLVDQNGLFVRYESYINRPMFTYILENELYNQEGQIEFVATSAKQIQFPANDDSGSK